MAQDEDNAWKDVLEEHFEEFLAFFFPEVHASIDWRQPVQFLEQEFVPLLPRSLRGKALVDKLARVRLLDGEETFVHLHVEVQGYPDASFAERLLRYNFFARERLGREVVSLGVLTDDRPGFRPCAYEYRRWGFELRMGFPTVKLLDYRGKEESLRADPNPFSVVVLAHLAHLDSPGLKGIYRAKLRLIRLLYRRGYDRERVRGFIRFLDWVLRLPEALEMRIMDVTRSLEGKKHMPFLSNIERWALRRGLEQGLEKGRAEGQGFGERQGLLEGIELGLDLRFGARGLELLPRLRQIQQAEKLRRLLGELKAAPSLEAFRGTLERP